MCHLFTCRSLEIDRPGRPGVRRSRSTIVGRPRGKLVREPSRLSNHSQQEATQGEVTNWNQELVQLQIASSALIHPLGNTESAAIADPRIIAEVTQARAGGSVDAHSTHAADSDSESQPHRWSRDLPTKAVEVEAEDARLRHLEPVAVAGARSIHFMSPFFAAAQQLTALAVRYPLTSAEPIRAPSPPLWTDSDSPVSAALERQVDAAEIIIPQASFSSLTSSPEQASDLIPLSPQATTKGFVTADSFKHEPGHTLLDCTDPTPNHSMDLDDPGLKEHLAQLLPNFPFPFRKKGVKRDLSSRLSSLGSLSEAPDEGELPRLEAELPFAPAPGSIREETGVEAKLTPREAGVPQWRQGQSSELGGVCETQPSQTGTPCKDNQHSRLCMPCRAT